MAVINHTKKWLYLMEPHTASRAVSTLLKEKMGASDIGHHHIGVPELTERGRCHIDERHLKEYDILATVRNPFDMLVTRWYFTGLPQHKQTERFEEWVRKNFDHPTLIYPCIGLAYQANIVLRYETIDQDLSTVFNRSLGLGLDKLHVTEGKKYWKNYYTVELLDFMWPRFAPFLNQFGYRMEAGSHIPGGFDLTVSERTPPRVRLP